MIWGCAIFVKNIGNKIIKQLDVIKLRFAAISQIEKEGNHGIYMLPEMFNLPEGKEMAGRE